MSSHVPPGSGRAQIQQELDALLERASRDAAFRQLCLSNPVTAIKQATGVDLPDGFVVRFVENQGADLTIVLPDEVMGEDELSDEDLDMAAGGVWWAPPDDGG